MHIPDGYLGPATFTTLYGVMTPIWAYGIRRLNRTLRIRETPMVALGAALAFAVMMFNIPIPGGSTGHPIGGTVLAIVMGPWAAMLSLTIALAVQALLFGDGGITTFGANAFNIAFILPFAGYGLYQLFAFGAPSFQRLAIAAGVAAYGAMLLSSLAVGLEVGLQPLLAHDPEGRPLYFPYGLSVSLPAMFIGHLAVFGPIEGIITASAVYALVKSDRTLLAPRLTVSPASSARRKLWWIAAGIVLLMPLGLWLPKWFASGTAWGEWSARELETMLGALPEGFRRFSHVWRGWFPDYSIAGFGSKSLWIQGGAYLLAGGIGVIAAALLAWKAARLFARCRETKDHVR